MLFTHLASQKHFYCHKKNCVVNEFKDAESELVFNMSYFYYDFEIDSFID